MGQLGRSQTVGSHQCGLTHHSTGLRKRPRRPVYSDVDTNIMRVTSSRHLLVFATLCAAAGLHAAPLNKCVINGSVSYQQAPCSANQEQRKRPTLDELNAAEKQRRAASSADRTTGSLPPREVPMSAPAATNSYRCDGRTHCSQMSSCEEATFFLKHCPGVKMDGDGNGIPCERQWCSADKEQEHGQERWRGRRR